MITIYDDGVHNNTALLLALNQVGYKEVTLCTASIILEGGLDNKKLLIMPGGADLYFCEKLNGQGNQKIQNFVSQGGSYLGICAGAYYGCSQLDWACGEISDERELALFHGKAIGPIYNFLEDKNEIYKGSWIYATEIETDAGDKFLTQYNGGPLFEEENCDVIARYSDLKNNPSAIIGGNFYEGKYILSSPHIENFGHLLNDRLYIHLNCSYEREKHQLDKLLKFEKQQKEFFKNIIERLL